MASKHDNQNTQAEYDFDVTKASEHLEFLGFIDGVVGSTNSPSGLFRWTCRKCGRSNHDAAIVETNQSFLAEWSCNHCDDVMLVRFRGRPITDWIAQHALAITGKALCGLAETEPPYDGSSHAREPGSKQNQKLFAWIAVPLLALLIVAASTDLNRLRPSLAYGFSGRSPATSYAWLGGYWVSIGSNDVLYFGYMNPAAHCGAYTRPARDGRPAQIVRFEILREETTDDKLVLRELTRSSQTGDACAIIYITKHDHSMVRMTTSRGEPVLTTYQRTGRPSGQ